MKSVLEQIASALTAERENTEKFRRQLHGFLETNDQQHLLDRLKKGSTYYKKFLQQNITILLRHLEEMKQKKRVKAYVTSLTDLDQLFSKKLEEVDKAVYLTECILEGRYDYDFSDLAEQRTQERTQVLTEIQSKVSPKKSKKEKSSKKSKKDEVNTYDLTLGLLKHGMTMKEIAQERGLALSTIEGHLARAVEKGLLDIDKLLSEADITLITRALKEMPEGFTSKDLFVRLGGKFSYGLLRAVMSHTGIQSAHTKGEKTPD
jgi:DNA-binding NarL/FixJ family response regulator